MRRIRQAVVVACALVVLAGCGSDAPTSTPGAPAASPTTNLTSVGKPVRIPDVTMVDVATGQKVSLHASVATDRPTLLWAWAPY